MSGRKVTMNRFGRVTAAAGVAAAMAAAVWGREAWMSGGAGPSAAAQSRVVIVASLLAAPGERGSEAAHAFDRLRIPADATEMQLSFATELAADLAADFAAGAAANGMRFETELVAIDGDGPPQIYDTTIEPGQTGAMARVVVPVPPDGDYVLRLRREDGQRKEIVVTKAFRLTRGPQGRVR